MHMNKILVVSIISTGAEETVIHIIPIPIHCSHNDEANIKHALESQKNDPRLLLAIIAQNISRSMIASHKKELDLIKGLIEKCEMLLTDFIDTDKLAETLATKAKDNILYNFCQN